jgi:ketosteroid isomerase-like protein
MRALPVAAALALFATPGIAGVTAATAEVAAALRTPAIADALAARVAADAALLANDADGFRASLAPDFVVNSPHNRISNRDTATANARAGRLHYGRFDRTIEHAATRNADEVVFMGEETIIPPAGEANAGLIVRRRYTDIWKRIDGRWLLSLRQATHLPAK